ncbi:MAG: SigE family RNA polymerase sigma factor [Acidimicrobiales bacterium]
MEWLTGRAAHRQFDRFADEVTDKLVRTAYLLTWDLSETEDLVQETLLRVARRWDRVRSMDHPIAYARRILVNLVIDGAQGRSRRNTELKPGPDGDLEALPDVDSLVPFQSVDAVCDLRWALGTLGRRQRAVIVLRYWEDLSEADVADLLGCSVGTVKSTAFRGLARLREVLGAAGAAPGITSPHPERTPSSC